jgi:hypothetical protein
VEGVKASQMITRKKPCLVEQRPGWIDEIDSSQQFGHHRLVELDAYGESTQLGVKQCTGHKVLTIYGPVEIGDQHIRLIFLDKELRRRGSVFSQILAPPALPQPALALIGR